MTVPAQNGNGKRDRATLKKDLFKLWDKDGDGALKKPELLQLARATGFDGTEEEWEVEYPEMCAEKGCTPEAGLKEDAVMALLDDDSDVGCFFTDEELAEILGEASVASKPAVSPDAKLDEPMPAASADAKADEPMPGADEAPTSRELLKRRLFALWDKDKDGFLKKNELLLLARATGFDGSDEEWAAEYPEMCKEKGSTPEEGLSEAAVLALFDDESDDGCYFSDQELIEILAEAEISIDENSMEAGGSSGSTMGARMAAEEDRQALKRRLFRLWDQDKDGFLKEDEMMQVALSSGFDGSTEEWATEYKAMCEEHKITPEAGFPKAAILALLDDESDAGAFLSTDDIKQLVEVLSEGQANPEAELEFKVKVVRDEAGKAGFSVRQADLVITNLQREEELKPMQNGDVLQGVNEKTIECFAEYTEHAHGVKEFTLSIKRPKEFEESDKWEGVKPGYCFKLGIHGVGYYRDVYDGVFAVMRGIQEFHPARFFQGEWPGHVFKMGHLGLGYYLDRVCRGYLKMRLFQLWDTDKDGRLNKREALYFAQDCGFKGEFKEFEKEYEQMCLKRHCNPAQGLSETAVSDMLEDATDRGCYVSSDDMPELIQRIEKATMRGKDLKAPASTASSVALAEIPIARLKALAKLHGVSLAGCCEKSEIVEALKAAGVADQGAAAVAAAAEKHLGDGGEKGEEKEERGAFQKKIMLCDDKGELKKDGILKMSQCVGWIGLESAWVDEFSKVFKEHGCPVKEEMTIAAVMALAEATKSQLLERKVGSADISDGPALKKQRVLPPAQVKKESVCEACEKKLPDVATVFCTNCKAFLCDKCNEDNHNTKLLKKHTRIIANNNSSLPAGTPVPREKFWKPLTSLSVAELKALAKKHCLDVTACVEKLDIITVLEKNNFNSGVEEEENQVDQERPAGHQPKQVAPPAKKAAPKEAPGGIRPPPKTKAQETERLEELYMENREKMGPGSQWELKTGVALWRNDTGWERTFFLNAKTPSGWPTIIEVIEYGAKRLKVRGMGVDRNSGQMIGSRWQVGYLELAMIVDKETGELLVQPNSQTGKVCEPRPKQGTGVKVLPKSHPLSKESQEKAKKDKESATNDPEAGATKVEGMEKTDVFKTGEDL